MGKINWPRVILGGLIAGLVVNIAEFLINGVILEQDWIAVMNTLGIDMAALESNAGAMVTFLAWGFIYGGIAVWLYAAIRPRYGAGPKTAVCAGVVVWLVGYLGPMVGYSAMGLWTMRLALIASALGLVEAVVATVLGAWLYKEA
ncbi:MAG: hypothetical protein ACRD1X_05185 [Vicinamibacteria bacterium]